MKTLTTVHANFHHHVMFGEHKIPLAQAIRELTSIIEGYPAAMQQPAIVNAMTSLGAVVEKGDRPRGRTDHWLEAGPNAADVMKQLGEAKLEAIASEERLEKAIKEAVANVDPEPDFEPTIRM